MKKNGFTLVEVLVTILLIGIIAVVTTPIVIDIIANFEDDAFKKGVEGVLRAIRSDADSLKFEAGGYRIFAGELRYQNRVINLNGTLKGEGTILIDENGDIKLGVKYKDLCAMKDYADDGITYALTCDIPIIPSLIDYSWMEEVALNTTLTDVMLSNVATPVAYPLAYTPKTWGASVNSLVVDTNPWGVNDILWKGINDATTSDGGFSMGSGNNTHFALDNTKNYRISIWVKNVGTTGTMYLFSSTLYSTQTSAAENVWYVNDSSSTVDPLITSANRGEWILMVGYLNHYNSIFEANMPAIYNAGGTSLVTWVPRKMNATSNFSRFYVWRTTATEGYAYFYRPRVDLIDGTEPSIADLLAGQENGNLYNN